ncbi:MAG TPA: hypothetical protein VFO37_09210 [Chitinophagaceae bacterium]|jgi:hypothetical protein|nr:hypothetical protein [Chitinophagaceae bacterium]
MEVHAHTHTPRKKWTHYFWEFLMLFLAVFCGFLAENQREHYIEHLREKQYMRSLLEDLSTDTATVKRVYNRALIQNALLDSLIELGNYGQMNEMNTDRLYFLHGQTTRFLNIRFEDGTSSQLKNAGGMRLVRNKQVGESIRQYWAKIEVLYRIRDRLETAGENIADLSSRIFYSKFFIYNNDDPLGPLKGIKRGTKFINSDPALIAEYINRVVSKSIRTKIYLNDLEETIQLSNQLITMIKKEYHLK